MPALARVYGLRWADIEAMSPSEVKAHLDDLALLVATEQREAVS